MALTDDMQAKAAALATMLLAETCFGDGFERARLRLAPPVAVEAPGGGTEMIFVPAAVDDRLVGYFLLSPTLDVHRWSAFATGMTGVGRCPSLADWTDPDTILANAVKAVPGLEPGREPTLSYDGVPDRLAWRVEGRLDGAPAVVFVAGAFAYLGER